MFKAIFIKLQLKSTTTYVHTSVLSLRISTESETQCQKTSKVKVRHITGDCFPYYREKYSIS